MQQLPQEPSLALKRPKLLHMLDTQEQVYFGANQSWYRTIWQRKAGCGPTVSAMMLWYLAHTVPNCAPLSTERGTEDGVDKASFLKMMQTLWKHVTPSMTGVNKAVFVEGTLRYAASKNVKLNADVLDIPEQLEARPSLERMSAFIGDALAQDLPVAFLNYSSGALRNLENWHWVTLIALEPELYMARMYDQGRDDWIDLALWLQTTTRPGWFVVFRPE